MLKICILVKMFDKTVFEGVIALFHKQIFFTCNVFILKGNSSNLCMLPYYHVRIPLVTCSRSVFFPGTPVTVSSTNKTYRQYITEILLKVVLNTINQTNLSLWQLNLIIFIPLLPEGGGRYTI